jgi:hypothetical protein
VESLIGFLRGQSRLFDPRCVLRQSSNDLYNLIDPESSDGYSTGDSGEGWIQVEFRDPIRISEIQVRGDPGDYPRNFDLIVTREDGARGQKKIRAAGVHGSNQTERYRIPEMPLRSVRIKQRGLSSRGEQVLAFRSLEFFSASGEYQEGVFKVLFRDHREEIRKLVSVTARDFDLNRFDSGEEETTVETGVRTIAYL